MLRAKIYINQEKIDEIQILNTGNKHEGETEYKVISEKVPFYVWHKRENGWEQLLLRVLTIIETLRN